jgi:hypothetical protein
MGIFDRNSGNGNLNTPFAPSSGGGGGGANTALSNLTATAINQILAGDDLTLSANSGSMTLNAIDGDCNIIISDDIIATSDNALTLNAATTITLSGASGLYLQNAAFFATSATMSDGDVRFQDPDNSVSEKHGMYWITEAPFGDAAAAIITERTATPNAPHDIVFKNVSAAGNPLSERMRINAVTGVVSIGEASIGNGATGTFTTTDLKTVTVTNGIVTSIV